MMTRTRINAGELSPSSRIRSIVSSRRNPDAFIDISLISGVLIRDDHGVGDIQRQNHRLSDTWQAVHGALADRSAQGDLGPPARCAYIR